MLVLVFLPVVALALRGGMVLASNPSSGIIVPLWSLAAYLWVCNRKQPALDAEMPSIR